MKKVLIILMTFILCQGMNAQQLQIKDSTIVLIENGQEAVIDSTSIAQKISYVKKRINLHDNKLLLIEAKRAEELEQKSKQQEMLTYFLEIKYKYEKLSAKIE